jgi:hypothetical protein
MQSGSTALQEVPVNKKRRVLEGFNAKLVSSRRIEKFGAGELLMLIDCPDSPGNSRFMRINGLRPNRGVECQYLIESDELNQKTEVSR